MFGKLFGNKKKTDTPRKFSHEDSLNGLNASMMTLRQTVQTLEKREDFLEKKMAKCLDTAKLKSKKGDKKAALFELKKKKKLEMQVTSMANKRLNLETQIMALEDAHINAQALKAMKGSSMALKSSIREDDLDKADETMEDISEAMDQIQEMNDAMAQPLGLDIDEDELNAELAELEDMEADDLLNEMGNVSIKPKQSDLAADLEGQADSRRVSLPQVPSKPIASLPSVVEGTKEDDELAELEDMMN